MRTVKRVCIESPLRGEVAHNVRYADACMLDALRRGEAPFAGHLLYPRVLDDDRPEHRGLGIDCHMAWMRMAQLVAVYEDLGISEGMRQATIAAQAMGVPLAFRKLARDWAADLATAGTYGFLLRSGGRQ
jgi:hypothetical protein